MKDLERAPDLVLGPLIQYHVIDSDEERVFGDVLRCLEFIGTAHQLLRALHRLMHMDDTGGILLRLLFLALPCNQ